MTETRTRRFVFRTDQHLGELIDQAVALTGDTLSDWLRSRLEYHANTEIADAHRRATSLPDLRPGSLGMSLAAPGGFCVHPRHARETVGVVIICKACGDAVGNLL